MATIRRNSLVLGACLVGLLAPSTQSPLPDYNGVQQYQRGFNDDNYYRPTIYEVNFEDYDHPPTFQEVIDKIRSQGYARELFDGVDRIDEVVPIGATDYRQVKRSAIYNADNFGEENYKPGGVESYSGRKRIRVGSAYLIG